MAMGMGVDIPSVRNVIHVGPHVQSKRIFKKLEGQVEMGSLPLRYYTTTIATLRKIEKE